MISSAIIDALEDSYFEGRIDKCTRYSSEEPKARLIFRRNLDNIDTINKPNIEREIDLLYTEIITNRNMDLLDSLITRILGYENIYTDMLYNDLYYLKNNFDNLKLDSPDINSFVRRVLKNIIKAVCGITGISISQSTCISGLIKAEYIKPDKSNLTHLHNEYTILVPPYVLYEHTDDNGVIDWGIYITDDVDHIKNINWNWNTKAPEFVYVTEEDMQNIGIHLTDLTDGYSKNKLITNFLEVFVNWVDEYVRDYKLSTMREWFETEPADLKTLYDKKYDKKGLAYGLLLKYTMDETLCSWVKRDFEYYNLYAADDDTRINLRNGLCLLAGRLIPFCIKGYKDTKWVNYAYRVYDTLEQAQRAGTARRILKSDYVLNTPDGRFMFYPDKQRLFNA